MPDADVVPTWGSECAGSAGVYIHIPFCARKCRYCDFRSQPYDSGCADGLIEALAGEWERARLHYGLTAFRPATVYIGGGTPSSLSFGQWERLLALIGRDFIVDHSCEWTVECNPESFGERTAALWASAGVNRLSLGVQTLDDRLLRFLGRLHTAARALEVLGSPAARAFASVGADVMYGLPGLRAEVLECTLRQVLATGSIDHVSAYELTIAPTTPFGRHRRLLPLPPEAAAVEQYRLVERVLVAEGFEHYEVSNYALPGHRSRHNTAYWRHEPYLGFGPAAHSFLPSRRWANVADVGRYVELVREGRAPVESTETLGSAEYAREILMLGLRTVEGVDAARFRQRTGTALDGAGRGKTLAGFVDRGLLQRQGDNYVPTPEGMLLADAMAARLCRNT